MQVNDRINKSSIFPIAVLVLSILAVLMGELRFRLELINSAIGIIGAVLYFLRRDQYRRFIYVWIYLQFILLKKVVMVSGYESEFSIFDLTQSIRFELGLRMSFNDTSYVLALNILPFAYLYAFTKLQVKDLVGKELTLRLYRDHEILSNVLPQRITIIRAVDFKKNENWLLAQLTNPITLNDKNYQHCLIKGKDDMPIIPDKSGQMAHLRLAEEPGYVLNAKQLDQYPFIDWVFVH